MATKKTKRELATTNIRIYPKTHGMLQELSNSSGKTIARVNDEAVQEYFEKSKKK